MVKQNANEIKLAIDKVDGKAILKVLSRVIGDDDKDSGAVVLLEDGSKAFVKEKDLATEE